MGGTFGMVSDKMINLLFFGFLISSASTFQSGRFVLPLYSFVYADDAVYICCCWYDVVNVVLLLMLLIAFQAGRFVLTCS